MRDSQAWKRVVRLVQLILVATASLVAFEGCGRKQPPKRPERPAANEVPVERPRTSQRADVPSADQFVGSAACASCHAKETRDFHGHPMSQSLVKAGQETPLEDYSKSSFTTLPGVTYYAEKTVNGVVHHEKRVDADGMLIYDQAIPVAYSVGSGTRGRSYLINQDGRLSVSAISWYANTGKWDLSPGYGLQSHPRFDRRASEGCLACHAGHSAPRGTEPNRFDKNPFLEDSIGCERCHGPGRSHVDYRSQVTDEGVDPIVNPVKLHGAQRDAVCNQCHLQGRRRVVRFDRREFDFSPGMNLSDVWTTFVKTEGIESGAAAAVSQVEQMYASHCYSKSDGGLSCIHCHDGHDVRKGEQVDLGFREKCVACHSTGNKVECSESLATRKAATAVDSCIVCHMPKFPAADVHASQTDHRILRRRPPEVPPRKPDELPDRTPVLFVEPGVDVPPEVIARARGIYLSEQSGAAGGTAEQTRESVELLIEAIKAESDDVEARYALGKSLSRIGQSDLAVQAWMQVLELQPAHEDALEALAIHYHESNDLPNARKYYERLLSVNPYRSQYYGRLAHVLGQMNQIRLGIEAAKKCLELNPSLMQSHAWLVEAYKRTNEPEQMKVHETLLERFNSTLKPKK